MKRASRLVTKYRPLASPALRMESSLKNMARGGAPAIPKPPNIRKNPEIGEVRINPRIDPMSRLPVTNRVIPAAKKQRALARL